MSTNQKWYSGHLDHPLNKSKGFVITVLVIKYSSCSGIFNPSIHLIRHLCLIVSSCSEPEVYNRKPQKVDELIWNHLNCIAKSVAY